MDSHIHRLKTSEKDGVRVYRGLFADSPNPYLVLTPNLNIVNGNDAYLAVTGRKRDELAGRFVFDAFPDNPDDPDANGVRNLSASFDRVRQQRCRDSLPVQRYDLCHDGVWLPHFWHPINWPIIDDDGTILALIHHVREVKMAEGFDDLMHRSRRLLADTTELADRLQSSCERLALTRGIKNE